MATALPNVESVQDQLDVLYWRVARIAIGFADKACHETNYADRIASRELAMALHLAATRIRKASTTVRP